MFCSLQNAVDGPEGDFQFFAAYRKGQKQNVLLETSERCEEKFTSREIIGFC